MRDLRKLAFCAGTLVVSCLSCATRAVTFVPAETEIVVAPDAPKTTRFAAAELQDLLGQRFGVVPPVVTAPSAGKKAIHVGDSAFVRAAGLDTGALPRDGFRIRTVAEGVCIAGRDDPKVDAFLRVKHDGVDNLHYERGTLFGVYDFLERFAGMRFYFPGELGTVVPKAGALDVPETDLRDAPDYTVRKISYFWDGAQTVPVDRTIEGRNIKTLNCYRQRFQTEEVSCCHGQNGFYIPERFAGTHPEYFQLLKDGARCLATDHPNGCVYCRQLCQSSDVWEEIYRDCVSYLKGEKADVRKIPHWRASSRARGEFAWGLNMQRARGGVCIDVMPQDGMKACCCEKCQAAYAAASNPKSPASELVWGRTADLARRLKSDGFDVTIVQMAYGDYHGVPSVDLPDNLLVMLATRGQWSVVDPEILARENADVEAWVRKLGHKVWLWNYPCKVACGNNLFPDIAPMAPRCWGAYYARMKPLIIGAYAESNCDKWIFNYLNYYIYGKVAWHNDAKTAELIDEHHRLMFGAKAAPHMAEFYTTLERKWVREVVGNPVVTSLGPGVRPPSENQLWFEVYSPEVLARLDGLLKKAESTVRSDSLEARRIRFVRDNFYTPLAARAEAYVDAHDVKRVLARQAKSGRPNLIEERGWYNLKSCRSEVPSPSGARAHALVSEKENANLYYTYANGAPQLKPNTKYRFSYFVRCEDLKPLGRWGGATASWKIRGGLGWVPVENYPSGTTDWQYFETTFETGDGAGDGAELTLRIRNAVGTAYFGDVRLVEAE